MGGAYAHKGMAGFYASLTSEDVDAVHAFLDRQQQRLPEMVEMSFLQKIEYWVNYGIAKIGERYPGLLNATRDMTM